MKCFTSMVVVSSVLFLAVSAASAQSKPPVHPLIRLFDTDKDGTLSATEIEKAGDKLKQFDASKDGKLTSEELRDKVKLGPDRRRGRSRGKDPIENTFLPKNDAEKKALATLKQMREGQRFRNVSSNDGRLLRLLAEVAGAKRVVEIGTSTGESGLCIALALRSTGGKLLTHELDPGRAKIARENFKKAGVDDLVTVIEGDAHQKILQHKEPIDMLFLDADKAGYIDYLNKLLPLIRPGGLIVAHNMVYPKPDPKYLKAITADPNLETSFLLMEGAGVGVTLKKR